MTKSPTRSAECSVTLHRRAVQLQSLKVLILDDHAASNAVLCHVLTSHGHVCEAVTTVSEALECVTFFRPDVVLYEWSLRDGSEVGVPRRLRAASTSVVAVIAISVINEPDGFCRNEDVDAYLTKPFEVSQLESVFARLDTRRVMQR